LLWENPLEYVKLRPFHSQVEREGRTRGPRDPRLPEGAQAVRGPRLAAEPSRMPSGTSSSWVSGEAGGSPALSRNREPHRGEPDRLPGSLHPSRTAGREFGGTLPGPARPQARKGSHDPPPASPAMATSGRSGPAPA